PQYIDEKGVVQNSIVTEGCRIMGTIDFSVLFDSVIVEEGATVRDSIVMPGSIIKSGALVEYAIIAENVVIENGVTIGERPENVEDKDKWGIAVIAGNSVIGKNAVIKAKSMVYGDVKEGEVVC
ncbi:MAG: glucose-1-phosphate adenylyltransferase, partial [Oscillospiraceae bacterium]